MAEFRSAWAVGVVAAPILRFIVHVARRVVG